MPAAELSSPLWSVWPCRLSTEPPQTAEHQTPEGADTQDTGDTKQVVHESDVAAHPVCQHTQRSTGSHQQSNHVECCGDHPKRTACRRSRWCCEVRPTPAAVLEVQGLNESRHGVTLPRGLSNRVPLLTVTCSLSSSASRLFAARMRLTPASSLSSSSSSWERFNSSSFCGGQAGGGQHTLTCHTSWGVGRWPNQAPASEGIVLVGDSADVITMQTSVRRLCRTGDTLMPVLVSILLFAEV